MTPTNIGLEGKRILVTGGSGFIGTSVTKAVLAAGGEVVILDRFRPAYLGARVSWLPLPLPDPSLGSILAKERFDALLHLAGTASVPRSLEEPVEDLRNNAEVTLALLEELRRNSPTTAVLFASSAAIYGNPLTLPITEDQAPAPMSPYGTSKLVSEFYVSLYARLHHMRTANLRLFSVYGPGQTKLVIYDIARRLVDDPTQLKMFGTGEETRDFIHVDDVARSAIAVLTRGRLGGEPYNVACGRGVAIREVVDHVAGVLGVDPRVEWSGESRQGDPIHWTADIGRLRSLPFESAIPLKDGIRGAVERVVQERRG